MRSPPPGTREEVLDQISRLDLPRGPGSFNLPNVFPTHVIKLNHQSAASTLALLPPELQAYVRADPETNTLAVSAPDVLVYGILSDITAIDVPRKHIMLDARVVVLESANLLNFGAEWTWPTIQAGTSISDAASPWELRIGYTPDREFTNALSLTLNLLSENNEATVIASPQVMAQDGKEAEIRVTTEEYFQITAETDVFLRTDLEKIETGTILRITPQIGPNGQLTLNMNVEVSDVVARGERGLPVINRRIARSVVQLENGGTAAVAGLADTRSQVDRSGVPGLQNVPLLGRSFRTDSLNHQARQVAVFVTATIVGDGDEQFESGRRRKPPVEVLDEETFRHELEAALNSLENGPTK